jgi:hypothetical protein
VEQAQRQRLTAATEDRRSRDGRDASTAAPGDRSDPVRRRPLTWEERRDARREQAKALVDPALAVVPHVVKAVDREVGERVEEALQALDRVTGGNTDGAMTLAAAAAQEARRRVRENTEKRQRNAEDRRYPAQSPQRRRQR